MQSARAARRMLVLAALAFVATTAGGQTLYKLIAPDGKITYSEDAPKDFKGKVIRIDVDPKANTATLPKAKAPGAAAAKQGSGNEQALLQSKEKVERARKALQDARDHPGEEDVRFVGNVGRGTRPVPTQAYEERLTRLEHELKEAEDELARAQKAR